MIRVRNVPSSAGLTSLEFFKSHPALHPFLLQQLLAAARQLQAPGAALHPSLFPILALLSRLR